MRILFLVFLFIIPASSFCQGLDLPRLDRFIERHDPKDKIAALYVMERCSGLFIYLSAVSVNDDSEKGKKFFNNSEGAFFRNTLIRKNYVFNNFENPEEIIRVGDKNIDGFYSYYSKLSDDTLDQSITLIDSNPILLDLKSCSDTFIRQRK